MKYSIAEFIAQTANRNQENNFFDLESVQTLEINLNGSVWTKLGSIIADTGKISFKPQGLAEQGLNTILVSCNQYPYV